MRFPLRLKFFIFATLLAILPLAIVGQNLTTLTRDELKSAANEDLTEVASQLRRTFDTEFQGRWLSPLEVIRNGLDSTELDVQQKVSLLTLGLQELPNIMALQLAIQDAKLPILVTNNNATARLTAAGVDPVKALSASPELLERIRAEGSFGKPVISRLEGTGDWVATIALPLATRIAGRQVTFAAKIDLTLLETLAANHPFAQRGEITVVDRTGRQVLTLTPGDLTNREIVRSAIPLIGSQASADTLQAYTRPDGSAMLGAYAFPNRFAWAIITEQSEESAYAVVNAITRQILIVGLVGFIIAGIGATVFARQLTRPILAIGQVAEKVGSGDFTQRVKGVTSRDEIGDLARRFNLMIGHLGERLELMKFVSHGTMSAIQRADEAGMLRGGERRRVSVIFTDIRGYTEFSERVPPEVVIEALNQYFDAQTRLVEKHKGDVDKFIGDALVAVFEGDKMEARATRCAVEIIRSMQALLKTYPDYNLHVGIGIASGEVVMGAMGAKDRMDFTVLGSTVNLAARLCANAEPDQVLIDRATRDAAGDLPRITIEELEAVMLKGYADPVSNFAAKSSDQAKTTTPQSIAT